MAFRLHREGKGTIPVSLLIIFTLVSAAFWLHPLLGWAFAGLGLGLVLLVFNFFRNPDLSIATHPDHILAPCDGKVVVIEEVRDTLYFNGPVTQVSIFMSPLNVHVNRNPITGTVRMVKYFPGKYLMAFNPKSSTLNEQTYIVAENDRVAVAYKQIAGFLARRIKYYVQEGEAVTQGAEYGFIKFGSRIDLLLPPGTQVVAQLGDTVWAGRTVIARIGAEASGG